MKKRRKSYLAIGMAFTMMLTLSACSQEETLKSVKMNPAKEEITVNEKVKITVETDPEDFALPTDAFVASGGDLGIKERNLVFSADKAGTYTVYAQRKDVKSNEVTITVKEKQQEETNDEPAATPSENNDPVSVDTVYENPDNYLDKTIKVKGVLPQTLVQDHSGNMSPVIWNDAKDSFLVLAGKQIDFGDCPALVTGTLSYDGNDYVLTVSEAEQL